MQWGDRWPGQVAWVCSTLFERVPPAPETKNIAELLSADSGNLRVKHVAPELLVEVVTVLYGADVARDTVTTPELPPFARIPLINRGSLFKQAEPLLSYPRRSE